MCPRAGCRVGRLNLEAGIDFFSVVRTGGLARGLGPAATLAAPPGPARCSVATLVARRGPGTPGGLPGGADSPEHATLKGARSAGGWPRRLGWPLGRGVRPRSRCPGASWRCGPHTPCGCGGPRSAVTRLGRRGVAVAVQVGRDDGEGVIRECAAQIMCSASDFGPVLLVSRDRAVFRRPRGHV